METEKIKNPMAVAMAKLRAQSLTPERRSEIARGAVLARIKKYKQKRNISSSTNA